MSDVSTFISLVVSETPRRHLYVTNNHRTINISYVCNSEQNRVTFYRCSALVYSCNSSIVVQSILQFYKYKS